MSRTYPTGSAARVVIYVTYVVDRAAGSGGSGSGSGIRTLQIHLLTNTFDKPIMSTIRNI